MSKISFEALEFLDVLVSGEIEYLLRSTLEVGHSGKELIEAGYAEIYERASSVPISYPRIVPHFFPTLVTPPPMQCFLGPTQQGIAYLKEHQGDLGRLAEV